MGEDALDLRVLGTENDLRVERRGSEIFSVSSLVCALSLEGFILYEVLF